MSRLYGSISYEDHHWVIKAEPHVAVRIKRVFQKISKGSFGSIHLADTTENSRELQWFLERYPMQVSPEHVRLMDDKANEHRQREALVSSILQGDYKPTEFDLAIPAREYQRQAADLLIRTGRLLLADDLGLGKTCSAICVLTDKHALPALIVAPTHLPLQWRSEIGKFAPNLKVHIIKTGKHYDLCTERNKPVPFPDVIVINYAKLAKWADLLAPMVNTVIYDEAQDLRHSGTNKYKAAEHISSKATYKLGLTASPVYNYGGEMFNVMDAIEKDCLGTQEEFKREFCNDAKYGEDENKVSIRDPKAFGFYLREQGLMLRRTRAEVGRELPPLTKIPYTIDSDMDELKKVGGSVAELAKIILDQGKSGFDKMKASGDLDWQMRQATGMAKAPFVADFVKMLLETEKKIVLYGWHHAVYKIWMERLKDFKPVKYTGEESLTQKEKAKDAFVNGDARVLVMSLRAGAGLDGLQGTCNAVVHGELDWSPKVHDQCNGRVHRDGQVEKTFAYYLISEHGSDPVISDVLAIKRAQSEGIINPNSDLLEEIQDTSDRMKLLAAQVLAQYQR